MVVLALAHLLESECNRYLRDLYRAFWKEGQLLQILICRTIETLAAAKSQAG